VKESCQINRTEALKALIPTAR